MTYLFIFDNNLKLFTLKNIIPFSPHNLDSILESLKYLKMDLVQFKSSIHLVEKTDSTSAYLLILSNIIKDSFELSQISEWTSLNNYLNTHRNSNEFALLTKVYKDFYNVDFT